MSIVLCIQFYPNGEVIRGFGVNRVVRLDLNSYLIEYAEYHDHLVLQAHPQETRDADVFAACVSHRGSFAVLDIYGDYPSDDGWSLLGVSLLAGYIPLDKATEDDYKLAYSPNKAQNSAD